MGKFVLANAQEVFMKSEEPIWKKAFNLTPFSIIPHYNLVKSDYSEILEKVTSTAPKRVQSRWLGIDEDTALVIFDEKKAEVLLFKNGK